MNPSARARSFRRILLLGIVALSVLLVLYLQRRSAERHVHRVESQIKPLKTFTIAEVSDAESLDPFQATTLSNLNIARLIFGTLYNVSDDGKLEPYLAESYTFSADTRELTFKLRPGLRCQDGSPLTARDVAYSFDRANDPRRQLTGNPTTFILPSLGYLGSHVDDRLTVSLRVQKYNPIALGLISEMFIVCKASYERLNEEQASTHPAATGPYRLAEWSHDDQIVLVRNQNFSLPAPSYDRVIWRTIPEGSTRSAELIAGNVDVITNVPADQVDAINNSDTAHTQTMISTRRIYVGFNQSAKFSGTPGGRAIQNPAVRVALQYAVDVPTICESLLRSPCKRAATMIVPQNDHTGISPFPYDPDSAEKMLDKAGYPKDANGVRFALTLQAPRGLYGDSTVAQAIGQYLSDIGVQTTVQLMDRSIYIALSRQHECGPLFLTGTGGSTWSALYDMSDLSTPDAGTNDTGWSDPDFYKGWKQLDTTRDPSEQTLIVNQMMHIMHDQSPWLMLYFQPDIYGVSNKIQWTPRADEVISLR